MYFCSSKKTSDKIMANFEKVNGRGTPDKKQPKKITTFQKSYNIFGTIELPAKLHISN